MLFAALTSFMVKLKHSILGFVSFGAEAKATIDKEGFHALGMAGESAACGDNATKGHRKKLEEIKKASDEDGRSCIGDPAHTDVDGHTHTADCTKDSTTTNGENTHFGEAEDRTHEAEGAGERVAAGYFDLSCG